MKHVVLRTPDNVDILVQEDGDPSGDPILFIHGFSQCRLSWARQTASARLRDFRLVSYDLRGHGSSGKPNHPDFYRDGRRWADELATVIDGMGLSRPVVVAWSYAGRIVADYLATYGDGGLGAINLVGSKTRSDPAFVGVENAQHQSRMGSEDLAENIAGTIAFLRTCSERWGEVEFASHLAFNMLVPPNIRRWLHGRAFDADALYRAARVPVMFTHGSADRVVPLAASLEAHRITRGSVLSVYEGVGHAPFVEASERFNDELAAFVTRRGAAPSSPESK